MNRIKELQEKILKAKDAYYNSDTPILTDKVFDAYVDELTRLDPNNPAITSVGADLRPSVWLKAKHQIPMGSLDKVNTPDQMTKWVNDNCKSEKLLTAEKLDGISINCVYENGNLIQAITRGSQGLEGEDILVNVKQMSGVKQHIKDFTGSLRGEIIMLKSNHKTYFSDKANPRNAASGTCKRFDGLNVDKLNVKFYQVLGNVDFKTEVDMFKWLKKNKIDTPNYVLVDSVDKVNELWQTYQDSTRATLDYDIDGLVISINDLKIQNSRGSLHLKPKGKLAMKFDNETAESTITAIDFQVGNSGRVTPVAYVEPVEIGGAMIKKASLYNMAYVNELGLDVGAKVLVARANDVIPRVEELVEGTNTIAQAPTKCPVCKSKLSMVGENLTCHNYDCEAQLIGRVENWVKTLNILELGDTLIEKLVKTKKVKDIADLYSLSIKTLSEVDRMGEKSATNVYNELWKNKKIDLDQLLGGLSIPMIGTNSIKLVMDAGINNLNDFYNADIDTFEAVKGMGKVKAKCLYDGLAKNRNLIDRILRSGLELNANLAKIVGKKIVITGKLAYKRSYLEEVIRKGNGELKGAISKDIDYLVANDLNSGSTKLRAAQKLGIPILTEEEFLNLPDFNKILVFCNE